jgi:hypothetical protein
MATSYTINIPMKDHPMEVVAKQREDAGSANVFDLYYCDELCGCIFKNEHNIWIYEPHAHAGLLLNAEQIQHLGGQIGENAYHQ